jgi:predicted secreted protein
MAANTGVIEGQDLLLYVGGTAVAHSTTCVLTPSVETRDRLTKDTGKFKTKVGGLIDWEVSADALAAYDGNSYHTLFALMTARAAVTIKFAGRTVGENWKTEQVGDKYFEGSAIITSMPMTAPNNADATFSISLTGTGLLDQKTKA